MQLRSKYDNELKQISDNLRLMFKHVEMAVELCSEALLISEAAVAKGVKKEERKSDKLETKIEKSCLRLMVMQQPVASDFRLVYAALKMVTDLERIGDQARDIAELLVDKNSDPPKCLPEMFGAVKEMVRNVNKAHADRDLALAGSLDAFDDKVDGLFDEIILDIAETVKKTPELAEQIAKYILVAKYLERIGDHAVNLGEWIQYEITGKNPKRKKSKTVKQVPDENILQDVSEHVQ